MPPAQRRAAAGVIEELLQNPQQFGFFQAIRLLEGWLAEGGQSGQGLSRLNFRNSLSLSFPPSEIESLVVQRHGEPTDSNRAGSAAASGDAATLALDAVLAALGEAAHDAPHALHSHEVARIDLTPAFMGLLGVTGALPLYYTETLAQREHHHKDRAARAFLDVFSHRAVALFYQAWRKHRLAVQYEGAQRQRFLPEVLALAGLGQRGLRERMAGALGGVADESLAFHAGALQRRTLSARQLQQVLQSYLKVPVRIEQFVGRWYRLPDEARGHLGMIAGGRAGQVPTTGVLGRSAMLGERVWQRDLRMRVVLGPLDRADLRRFLPGGRGAAALKSWLTMLNGVALEYEVNLTLQRDEVQGCTLGSHRSPHEARLGWDTFLQTRPATQDRSDVHYDIHAAA
ncbi:MAG: type VI secretion system baseplate subunit TssG [Aquabacterium sp.]|nr:MAG: type VI secretion system baseplate subunit TssG [Aquabacterium sp.]